MRYMLQLWVHGLTPGKLSTTLKCFIDFSPTDALVQSSSWSWNWVVSAWGKRKGCTRCRQVIGLQEGKGQNLPKYIEFCVFFGCFPVSDMSTSLGEIWLLLGTALSLNIKGHIMHFQYLCSLPLLPWNHLERGLTGASDFLLTVSGPEGPRGRKGGQAEE